MSMNRRDFVLDTARATALTSIGMPLAADLAQAADPDLAWHKAPCRFCGTGCGVIVGVKDGRVVAVQGDPKNPVNKGLLCAKGYHLGGALVAKDRLVHPQVRKDGKMVRVSWEEAVDTVARGIMKDPARFGIYGSGQWTIGEGFANMKFLKGGMGNNHLDPNARLCMASAVVGFITTFGVDEPSGCYDDLDTCDTVLCWGNNWAEMHPVLFSRFIDRRSRGDKVVMIDMATRRTRTTEAADHYLEFVPQTDLAIANCICHQLLASGRYDKAFVEKHVTFKANDGTTLDLSGFAKFLEDYTPSKVSALSGVPVKDLEMLGDLFADP
jgi:nitrate reductase NapA